MSTFEWRRLAYYDRKELWVIEPTLKAFFEFKRATEYSTWGHNELDIALAKRFVDAANREKLVWTLQERLLMSMFGPVWDFQGKVTVQSFPPAMIAWFAEYASLPEPTAIGGLICTSEAVGLSVDIEFVESLATRRFLPGLIKDYDETLQKAAEMAEFWVE